MRLLIAEDELWLRKRLVSTIDWPSYGISEVYEAEDGGEALEIALKEKPDIVITDIRMPELSGIDLMKKLNENSIFSKMIVVSGYDDFEYAQGALRMGAINYLETDFDDVDLKELKDIRKIRIDRNHTKEKRIAQYLRQVGNPYLVCIGNVKVKIRFANNGVSFEDAFEELLLSV